MASAGTLWAVVVEGWACRWLPRGYGVGSAGGLGYWWGWLVAHWVSNASGLDWKRKTCKILA